MTHSGRAVSGAFARPYCEASRQLRPESRRVAVILISAGSTRASARSLSLLRRPTGRPPPGPGRPQHLPPLLAGLRQMWELRALQP